MKKEINLLATKEEYQLLAEEIGKNSLMAKSILAEKNQIDKFMLSSIEIPGQGEAGGYEHNRHKQNYIHIDLAARYYLISKEKKYGEFAREILLGYADKYPTIPFNTSKDSNPPGKLFHQTLNECMWLTYACFAYANIIDLLSKEECEKIKNNLFLPMAKIIYDLNSHDFDIIHNHGLWSVAAVGICGFALDNEDLINKAIYGLKGDGETGGFLAQLNQLFSPDGYYMEGPYYHRFGMWPIYLLAEVINRHKPELEILKQKDNIICKTTYTLLSVAFPNGVFPAFNDASKEMNIADTGVVLGTSLCFNHYGADDKLLQAAKIQNKVWVHPNGLALSKALENSNIDPILDFGSLTISDGQNGEQGGLGILRSSDRQGNKMTAMLWYGGHGSDHKLHKALDHGHFDGLSLIGFSRNKEFLFDYGFGRWVNVEPKFGGRYISENDSYCKQTIAHNTIVVDEMCQHNFDTAKAQENHGNLEFFYQDSQVQAISAFQSNYFANVQQQRTILWLEDESFEAPLLVDISYVEDSESHQYDYPIHYQGQIMRTDFNLKADTRLMLPLGEKNGYHHLLRTGQAWVKNGGLISWLQEETYYSSVFTVSGNDGNIDFITAQSAGNDPEFNLKVNPLWLLRVQGKKVVFANVIETHGLFREEVEESLNAMGTLISVKVLKNEDKYTILEIDTNNITITIAINRFDNKEKNTYENFSWDNPISILKRIEK